MLTVNYSKLPCSVGDLKEKTAHILAMHYKLHTDIFHTYRTTHKKISLKIYFYVLV